MNFVPHSLTSDGPEPPSPGVAIYKGGDFKSINKFLREVKNGNIRTAEAAWLSPAERDNILKYIVQIDSKMTAIGGDAAPPLLFRGASFNDFSIPVFSAADIQGRIIATRKIQTWWGYTSTSSDRRKALKFAKDVLFEIQPLNETGILDFTRFSGLKHQKTEDEILLERGTRFKVTSVGVSGGKCIVKVTLRQRTQY